MEGAAANAAEQGLLVRGIAWKQQERALGGMGKLELRKLATLANALNGGGSAENDAVSGKDSRMGSGRRSSVALVPAAASLREGNRLVREWNGTSHTVMVLASGFEWQGRRYRSLSQIAEAITGAHWSGPRFFGLTSRKPELNRTRSEEEPTAQSKLLRGAGARREP